MSSWPLQQRYGSGVARILLPADPVLRSAPVSALPKHGDPLGAALIVALIGLSFVLALSPSVPSITDPSDLRIVWLERELEPPMPVVELVPPSQPVVRPPVAAAPEPPVSKSVLAIQTPAPQRVAAHEVPPPARPPQINSLTKLRAPSTALSAIPRFERPRAPAAHGRVPVRFDLPVATEVLANARPEILGRRDFERPNPARTVRPQELAVPTAPLGTPFRESERKGAAHEMLLPPRVRVSQPADIAMPGVSRSASPGESQRLPAVAAAPPGLAAVAVGSGSAAEAALRGVSLGTLAACRSDRREDLLKQRVIASVTTRKQCASDAGTYRFIETRNLNAFLMWVERNPSRPEANRCGELELAMNCLKDWNGKETRTP